MMSLVILGNFETLEEAQKCVKENKDKYRSDLYILYEPNYDKYFPWTVNID